MDRAEAVEECVALVREAVAARDAHLAALRMTPEERAARPETWRLPDPWKDWYARAAEAVERLEVDGGP